MSAQKSPDGGVEAESRLGDPGSPALLTRLERGRTVEQRLSATGGNGSRLPGRADGAEGDVYTHVNTSLPAWIERLLRIPLPLKIFGANLVLLAVAAAAAVVVRHHELGTAPVLRVLIVAFVAALLINTGLVMLAVRPIHVLEKTVNTIWRGDLGARVPVSLLADRHIARVARMFNILLDGLVADRARTRRLATELIGAADRERAAIARELHDSAAQSLAALVMQLSVASRAGEEVPREALQERIETARVLATSTLEEVRLLAHTMHPRVLDDLGLIAALRRLARETTEHLATAATSSGDEALVEVVAADGNDEGMPAVASSVLYRVAQEAVSNARRHASASHIEIRLQVRLDAATLEVVDDGSGFDPAATPHINAGIGLFTMRERVALMDGEFRIRSKPGAGTSVLASIPLHASALNSQDGHR